MRHVETVLDYLDRQAALRPDSVALADSKQQITFAQLADRSDRLAAALLRQGLKKQAIGVVARRSAEVPVLFFAVLKTGSFYVPLDPDMKPEKMAHICANADLRFVLDTEAAPELPDKVQVIDCSALWDTAADAELLQTVRSSMCAADPLYLIYTSGSTGVPKGVLKSHGAMISYIEAFTARYPLSEQDALGNQTPFFFDASSKDIYWMLHDGVRLEVLDTSLFSQPYVLVEYLNEKHITVISWVPSALSIISQLNTFADILPAHLHSVFFIGEVFPMKQFNIWKKHLPDVRYVNLYGQSELAGACCCYEVDRPFSDDETLPIGTPLENARILLLDGSVPVTDTNTTGEICIISPALADGYYKDAEKTAATFVTYELDGTTVRMFRTGDMARWDDSGKLVFAARRDAQIKHMGYRIELGEIEAAAGSLDEIIDCTCLYDTAKSKIVLFCTAREGVTKAALRKALRGKLSTYMIPSKIEILPQLPRNANGKTDRVALKSYLQ